MQRLKLGLGWKFVAKVDGNEMRRTTCVNLDWDENFWAWTLFLDFIKIIIKINKGK
jgi:hypothetical protein